MSRKNVTFSYAVNAWMKRLGTMFPGQGSKITEWVFHTFHCMRKQNPGLFETRMHEINAELCMQQVLNAAESAEKRLSYKRVLPAFFRYCALRGWRNGADNAED